MKFGAWMLSLALVFVFNVHNSWGESVMIDNGKTVKFDYTLYVDGQVADTSEGRQPLEYVHGSQMIISGLEDNLVGMKAGDQKEVVVAPEQGYGPVDPNAFLDVPKTMLASEIIPQTGMVLQVPTKDGQTLSGVIEEVKDDSLKLNFNHPLAGKTLKFDVKIVTVQ